MLTPHGSTAYVLHDDSAYLAASIASVRAAVPVFAFVSRLPWHGEPGGWERAAEIARIAGAEVIVGDWADETVHRRAALEHARENGFTHVLIPDGDEIIEPKLLAALLQIAQHELAERVFAHMDTFWKSDRYVIRPREAITPAILLDLRVVKHEHIREFTGGRPLLLSPEHGVIRHMSYAGSNERILRKITTWSHRDEVVPGWYENVWLGWDENKLMRNLHPTHPGAYGFAERVFTAEGAEEGKGSREDATARSAEVGQGFLDRIARMNRMGYRDRVGARWPGQRARRVVCSGMEVPVMTERGSVSGKAGQRRSRPRRAAPPTPDALHPNPVRNNENRCLNEVRPSGANHTYAYGENGLRWSSQMGGSVHVHNSIWVDDDVINDYVDGGLSARYDVVDGEVLAIKQGANRYAYVPDPLGSINHLLDTSLNKATTYVYWPYGELQTDTGAGSNRKFVGALGYDTLTTNRLYVRAREYRPDLGRWQTEDPVSADFPYWGGSSYVQCQPTAMADPSGLDHGFPGLGGCFPGGVPRPDLPIYGYDPPIRPPSWPPFRLPRIRIGIGAVYGQFCGPQNVLGDPLRVRDGLDKCCMAPDACFGKHPCPIHLQFVRPECLRCNRDLCLCVLGKHCRWWDIVCHHMRPIVIMYACQVVGLAAYA